MRVVNLAIVRTLLATAVLLGSFASDATAREPNGFERAYTAMALDIDDHGLCARISPEAETRLLFNSPGTQVYRERSRCFLYVAVNTLNPYFCQFVIEASARLHDGSYFGRQNCEALVRVGQPFNFSLSFDRGLILTEMGYSLAEIQQAFPGVTAEEALHRFYLNAVGRDGDFQRRLQRLPDFSGDR